MSKVDELKTMMNDPNTSTDDVFEWADENDCLLEYFVEQYKPNVYTFDVAFGFEDEDPEITTICGCEQATMHEALFDELMARITDNGAAAMEFTWETEDIAPDADDAEKQAYKDTLSQKAKALGVNLVWDDPSFVAMLANL